MYSVILKERQNRMTVYEAHISEFRFIPPVVSVIQLKIIVTGFKMASDINPMWSPSFHINLS